MAGKDENRTRERILTIAGELFAGQGYAGTSIADIAGRLGTSKAAIYYHFKSKEDILDALLTPSLDAYARIADAAPAASPADVLAAVIDLTAEHGVDFAVFDHDPSALYVLEAGARRRGLSDRTGEIIEALAGGPGASIAERIRAHAAFAVAKEACHAARALNNGKLGEPGRAEVLGAALRALGA